MTSLRRNISLLAAFCLLLATALVATGCGGDDKKSSSANPEATVKAALEKASTITSGTAAVKAAIATGDLPGTFDISGGGPFDTEAAGGGAFDLDLTVQVAGTDQQIGFAKVDGKSYIKVGERAVEQDGDKGIQTGQITDFIENLDEYISGVKQVAGKTVDGESLDVYTMKVDLKKMISDSREDGGDLSNLSIPGVGSAEQLSESLSTADGTLGIAGDGFPHEIGVNIPLELNGNQGGIRATLVLSGINEPVEIEKPSNVSKGGVESLGALGQMLAGQ